MHIVDKYTEISGHKRLLIGACSALIVLLIIFLGGEDTEISAGEISAPPALEQKEKPRAAPARKILGTEKAALEEKLADPFSIAHLTREEMEQAKLAAEAKQRADLQRQEYVQEPAVIHEVIKDDRAGEKENANGKKEVVLQGIVKGEHGGMAILKLGDKSVTAAAGEAVGGRTISEIDSNEVKFDDGGSIKLQVP